jgi:membrane-associated phospholipid phosphatase
VGVAPATRLGRVLERASEWLLRWALALALLATLGLHAARAAGAERVTARTTAPPGTSLPATPTRPPSAAAVDPLPPYKFQPGVLCPLCKVTPEFPGGRTGLHWHGHWGTVGVREYVTVSALAVGVLGFQLFAPRPQEPRWEGPILFDDPLRDVLRFGSSASRDTAARLSDVLFVWEVLHPSLIDPLLVAWWQRKSPGVAWQMLVIDAQAYGLTLLLNDLAKNAFARARPSLTDTDCERNPDASACAGGRNLSFYSGHAAITATGAGLLCAHHTQLSLYQNDYLDTGTCALAVLGTALTGALRIAADKHWASDVLVGHLMGYASGYLLPTLLYYKEFRAAPHDHPDEPTVAALPLIRRDALGVSLLGLF